MTLTRNVPALLLAFHERVKVVVVALTSGVLEQLALTRGRIVPIAAHAAGAVAEAFGLCADGLGRGAADLVPGLALVSGRTVVGRLASLPVLANSQRISIFANNCNIKGCDQLGTLLTFRTKVFAVLLGEEVVVISQTVVDEAGAAALLCVVVEPAHGLVTGHCRTLVEILQRAVFTPSASEWRANVC